MKTVINNVNIRYEKGEIISVSVSFEIFDEERKLLNANGYRNLTFEEYEGNESLESLERIIRKSLRELGEEKEATED